MGITHVYRSDVALLRLLRRHNYRKLVLLAKRLRRRVKLPGDSLLVGEFRRRFVQLVLATLAVALVGVLVHDDLLVADGLVFDVLERRQKRQ